MIEVTCYMQHKEGFTLVEVLVASVIMFTVLTVATALFSNARNSSEKAQNTIHALAQVSFILDTIRTQIRDNPQEKILGEGQLQQVNYQWNAQAAVFKPPQDYLMVETMEVIKYQPRFYLYDVTLILKYKHKEDTFMFREIAWKNAEPLHK